MKNWIKSTKKPLLNVLFAACFTLLVPAHLFAPPVNQPPMMPEMSPQQMEELQKEMEKINEEMQAFVKTLPPEKQEEIAQLEDAINNMSDEELEQLFEQLFTDPNFLQELENMYPEQPAQPEAAEQAPEPIALPVEKPIEKPKVEKNKLLQAAQMIKSLSDLTEAFLTKLDAIAPELDDIVQNWIKKGQLQGWNKNAAWHDMKAQIDLFNQKLKKMLQKDAGTNEYRFLPDLTKEESVYNNLAHMESVLKVTVPKIEVGVFSIEKLNKDSKEAVKSALNKYGEGMSTLQLIPSMNAVIEKHEPIAKQLREKEAALAKTALEESKKTRTEKSMVTAGRPEQRPGNGSSRDYADSGYYPSSNYQSSYSPSYSPEASTPEKKPAAGGGAGAGKGGSGGKAAGTPDKGGKPDDKGKDKDKDKDKGKDKKKDDKKDDKKSDKPVSPLQKKLEVVETKLKDANKASGDPLLINMRAQLEAPGPVREELPGVVQGTISKINAATAAINDLGKELANEPDTVKKDIRKRVNLLYNTYPISGNIERISEQLNFLKKDWSKKKNTYKEAKVRAYGLDFDTKKPAKAVAPVETNVDTDVVPQEVQDAIAQMQAQSEQAGRPADETAVVEQQAREIERLNAELRQAQKSGNTAQEAKVRGKIIEAEQKRMPEVPNTLDAAIMALKQAIENLAK